MSARNTIEEEQKMKRKSSLIFLSVALMVVLSACGSGGSKGSNASATPKTEDASNAVETSAPAGKKVKIGYISKLLTHPWFQQEEFGMKKEPEKLGIEFVSVDANLKDEAFLAAMDNLIAQKVDALAVVATNQGMGPIIAKKAAENNIALITIDDSLKDSEGKQVPHVGMPTQEVGMMGGEALAKAAIARDFFKAGNKVKVLAVDSLKVSVVHERTLGYIEGLKKQYPDLKDEDIIIADTKDANFEDVLPVVSSTLNANPNVTHWIVTAGNDDGALAAIKIFEEAKFNMKNILACGLGGYELSLNQFKKGGDSANAYMVVGLGPDVEGAKAINILNNFITKKEKMPENTYVGGSLVNVDNYLTFFPNGKLSWKQ
jgi:L-arabinose transport system substrate-binding protein